MADEATQTTDTPPAESGTGPAATGSPQTFTQEQVNDLIAREKGRFQQKYGDYDDIKAKASKFDELQEASKSEQQKLEERVGSLEGEVGDWRGKALRYEAAAKAGLDLDLALRIQGSTPEEMEADAKALAERFGSTPPAGRVGDGGPRTTASAGDMNSFIRAGARSS